MKLVSLTLTALTLLAGCISIVPSGKPETSGVGPAAMPPPGDAMADGIDRNGSDYRDFDLPNADPLLCRDACLGEARCQAWTYVKPGVQGDAARCWLKEAVPPPTPDACCVSGVRVGQASTYER